MNTEEGHRSFKVRVTLQLYGFYLIKYYSIREADINN